MSVKANGVKYQERIVRDAKILAGKPVVKGTRVPVELVLAHLAQNPDLDDLFAAYPRLKVKDVQACLAYAQRAVEKVPTAVIRPRRRVASGRGEVPPRRER